MICTQMTSKIYKITDIQNESHLYMILYVIHVHEFDLHIYSDIRSLFFSLSDKNVLIKTKVQHFLHYFMNGVMCAIKEFEVLYTETYVTHTHTHTPARTNHICTNKNFHKM